MWRRARSRVSRMRRPGRRAGREPGGREPGGREPGGLEASPAAPAGPAAPTATAAAPPCSIPSHLTLQLQLEQVFIVCCRATWFGSIRKWTAAKIGFSTARHLTSYDSPPANHRRRWCHGRPITAPPSAGAHLITAIKMENDADKYQWLY